MHYVICIIYKPVYSKPNTKVTVQYFQLVNICLKQNTKVTSKVSQFLQQPKLWWISENVLASNKFILLWSRKNYPHNMLGSRKEKSEHSLLTHSLPHSQLLIFCLTRGRHLTPLLYPYTYLES
jgi:hypothetical protein